MEWTHIVAFNIAFVAAFLSPGPAMLYALRATVQGGRTAGLATGAGLAVMAALWTLMALLGLGAAFQMFPWAYAVFKVCGAAYLIYIAIQTWRHANDDIAEVENPKARAFLGGFLVNLANPKSVLFSAAVLVVVFPIDLSGTEKAFIFGNHLVLELIAYTVLTALMSREIVSRQYLRAKPIFDRIAAAVLGALGVRLLVDR